MRELSKELQQEFGFATAEKKFRSDADPVILVQAYGANLAFIYNEEEGHLTLMIDSVNHLGFAQYGKLVDFCTGIMGCEPLCSYKVSRRELTGDATDSRTSSDEKSAASVLVWHTGYGDKRAFLQMMANSDGFINGRICYDIKVANDRKLSDYRHPALRVEYAERHRKLLERRCEISVMM